MNHVCYAYHPPKEIDKHLSAKKLDKVIIVADELTVNLSVHRETPDKFNG
jgi:hypothetical protein